MDNYPKGFRPLEDTGAEDPCPQCHEGEMVPLVWWQRGQELDLTDSLECLDCGHTVTVEEYEKCT